jgi:allantoinase
VARRTVITGGLVGNPDGVYRADVVIDGERISAITTDASQIEADERIDATGLLVVPGGVDAHTHFRDPDPNQIEGFYTGSLGAIAGGITSVVEMPQAVPVSSTAEHIKEKIRVGSERSIVDFALWGAAINQDLSDIEEMIDAGIVAVKSFMAGSSPGFPKITDASMYEVFLLLSDTDIPYGLHAENDDLLQEGIRRMQESGRTDPMAHAESRPAVVEAEAINRAIFFAEQTGAIAYICHTSTASGLQLVAEARARGVAQVYAETCPQYLALDQDDLARLGPFGRCAPAIRSREEVEHLWFSVFDHTMDVISSDHCGYTIESKRAGLENIWEAPLGLSGVQTMFPAMLDEFLHKRDLDLSHFVRMTSTNPARIFSLYPRKGVLRPGSDADVVLYDPNESWTVRGDDMLHRNKWTPFEGKTIQSRVKRTIIRGQTVYQFDGEHRATGEAGFGRFLRRGYGWEDENA